MNGDTFFYENSLHVSGDSTFNDGATTRQPWFTCACCPTNLTRFIPQIPGLIYAVKDNRIYVNLYISNNAQFEAGHSEINLKMVSGFPWKGNNRITVSPVNDTKLTFALRIPSWNEGSVINGDLYAFADRHKVPFEIKINDEKVDYKMKKGYLLISRTWHKGDKIDLNFTLEPRLMTANANVASDSGKVALQFGPLLYCAEGVDNKDFTKICIDGDSRFSNKTDLGLGIPYLEITAINPDRSEVNLIPYSFWSNRGQTAMSVWVAYKM